jgi:hypothetical protein
MTRTLSVQPPSYTLDFTFDTIGRPLVAVAGESYATRVSYEVHDEAIVRVSRLPLPAELADLIDIALAVYTADRICSRRRSHADLYHRQWTRNFHVNIPVRDPVLWSGDQLKEMLEGTLWWLTEDNWSFRFTARTRGWRTAELQSQLLPSQPTLPLTVALFSGGLDSLAGICLEAVEAYRGALVLLSGSTSFEARSLHHWLIHQVRCQTGHEILSIPVTFRIKDRPAALREESTQRSRGFIFLILGAITALEAGGHDLQIYENGVGGN